MSLFDVILLLVVAAIIGSLGQMLVGFSRGGCLVSMIVGFVGAYIGWWLAGQLRLPELLVLNIGGHTFPVIWAIIGSAIFAGILGLLAGRRAYY